MKEDLKKQLKKVEDHVKVGFPDLKFEISKATYFVESNDEFDFMLEKLDKDGIEVIEKKFPNGKLVEYFDKKSNANIINIVNPNNKNKSGWLEFEIMVDSISLIKSNGTATTDSKNPIIKFEDITLTFVSKNQELVVEDDQTDYKKLYEQEKELRLRQLADVQNERKRMNNQREEFLRMASTAIIKDIFEIVDDLKRALSNEIDKGSLEMIVNKFLGILNNYGVIPSNIKVGDKFDPAKMEALSTIKVQDENQDNTIIHIDQLGFIYKDDNSMIRPSRVIVGKK